MRSPLAYEKDRDIFCISWDWKHISLIALSLSGRVTDTILSPQAKQARRTEKLEIAPIEVSYTHSLVAGCTYATQWKHSH